MLLAAAQGTELERLCVRREAGEFLEQLVGAVEIHGETLAVGPGVFVPRQRTSLLIQASIVETRARRHPVVLEAYCGVAPIASLIGRRVAGVQLHATDSDQRALELARVNLPVGAQVHHGPGMSALPSSLAGGVDLIAAVPPYVPSAYLDLMPRDSREHEPAGALVAGADGLDEVRRLLKEAPPWLAPGGTLLIEMHRDQAPIALAAAREAGSYSTARYELGEDGETALLRLRNAPVTSPREAGEPRPR